MPLNVEHLTEYRDHMHNASSTRPEFFWNDWRYGSSWPNL